MKTNSQNQIFARPAVIGKNFKKINMLKVSGNDSVFGNKMQSFDNSQRAATDINQNEFVYNQVMANASA